jgi:hypothetical protein
MAASMRSLAMRSLGDHLLKCSGHMSLASIAASLFRRAFQEQHCFLLLINPADATATLWGLCEWQPRWVQA